MFGGSAGWKSWRFEGCGFLAVLCTSVANPVPTLAAPVTHIVTPSQAILEASPSLGWLPQPRKSVDIMAQRKLISSGSPFEAQIGYSRAVSSGEWVFVSGCTG